MRGEAPGGTRRVIEFGQTRVASEVSVSTHFVWSGVDLPARAAAGDAGALAQLQSALSWMLGAARVTPTQEYGVPAGDRLDNETATSTFLDGSHWRIELHAASLESYPSIFQVISRHPFDECYHLAAQSFVAESFADGFSTCSMKR